MTVIGWIMFVITIMCLCFAIFYIIETITTWKSDDDPWN